MLAASLFAMDTRRGDFGGLSFGVFTRSACLVLRVAVPFFVGFTLVRFIAVPPLPVLPCPVFALFAPLPRPFALPVLPVLPLLALPALSLAPSNAIWIHTTQSASPCTRLVEPPRPRSVLGEWGVMGEWSVLGRVLRADGYPIAPVGLVDAEHAQHARDRRLLRRHAAKQAALAARKEEG